MRQNMQFSYETLCIKVSIASCDPVNKLMHCVIGK
jgi:hypothetical protein